MQHHAGRGSGKRQRFWCSSSSGHGGPGGLRISLPAGMSRASSSFKVQQCEPKKLTISLSATGSRKAPNALVTFCSHARKGSRQCGRRLVQARKAYQPPRARIQRHAPGRRERRGGTPPGQRCHRLVAAPLARAHASSPWHEPGIHPSSLSRMHPQRALCMLRGPTALASTRLQPAPAPPPPGRASAPWVA